MQRYLESGKRSVLNLHNNARIVCRQLYTLKRNCVKLGFNLHAFCCKFSSNFNFFEFPKLKKIKWFQVSHNFGELNPNFESFQLSVCSNDAQQVDIAMDTNECSLTCVACKGSLRMLPSYYTNDNHSTGQVLCVLNEANDVLMVVI